LHYYNLRFADNDNMHEPGMIRGSGSLATADPTAGDNQIPKSTTAVPMGRRAGA